MIKNYLKTAIRSLLKQRVYTIINILGLAIGVASCILISMFIIDEFSYDSFYQNSDRIYKISLERKYPNYATYYATIPHSFGDVIPKDFPEVERVARIFGPFQNTVVSYKNEREEVKQFEENGFTLADSSLFVLFNIPMLKGDAATALLKPNDIVLTEETAKRYFSEEDPIGKTITTAFGEFRVTGVCTDLPNNTHIKFDFVASWNTFPFAKLENFTAFNANTYLLLKPNADAGGLESKFTKMVDTYAAAQIERELGKSWADYKREGNGYRYYLQPITSIHLDPTNIEGKMRPGGNINYVYFLIAVSVLILVIACINFMNLATARSTERAREVGVRKTMGSLKGQLISQFLIESILVSVVATLIAILLVALVLPQFNILTEKELSLDFTGPLVPYLILFALTVGALAGSYPAFVLSGFNPVLVMKGSFSSNAKGAWLRNGLVVFQFSISIILMIGTLVIRQQMDFMQQQSLGFNKDQVVAVERVFTLDSQLAQTFIDEIRRMPEIESVAGSSSLPGVAQDFFGAMFQPVGSSETLTTKGMIIDDDYMGTLGFKLLEGRGFSKQTSDSLSVLLNQVAAKTLGLTDPVGAQLDYVQQTQNGNVLQRLTIIGIVNDFNFQSLRNPITPLVIFSNEQNGGGSAYANARVKGKNISAAITKIEQKWKELVPEQPFKYTLLDDTLNAQYEAERLAQKLFTAFSTLAILVACVGLFGLAAYTASLRTREIGIRKVLGASVGGVIILLSKDFTKMVLIAFLIAAPLSWYVMENYWLSGFAYRISLGFGVFLVAGVVSLLISWITVSYQSIKAALVNPVKSLRNQ